MTVALATIARGQAVEMPAPPAVTPLSAEELTTSFKRVLGDRFTPASAAAVDQASQLLESFFTAPGTRDAVSEKLAETKLTPDDAARLCRVRRLMLPEMPGIYHVKLRIGTADVDYVIGIPAGYVRTAPLPLLVRLTEARDTPEQIRTYVEKKLTTEPKTLVIVPACDADERWGPGLIGMRRATDAVRHASDLVNVDPARIALIGSGTAGSGVWHVGLHFPTYFSSLGILGGKSSKAYERIRLQNLGNVPVALWHDATDKIVPVDETRQVVKVLQRFQIPLDYVETKTLGHDADETNSLKIDGLVRSKTRDLNPPRVSLQSNRPELAFNRSDWLVINQPKQTGDVGHSIIPRSRNTLTLNSLVFRADAAFVDADTIEFKVDNVDSFRLYVSGEQHDFSKPLTIRAGRKEVFKGIVQPRFDVMLRDQLLLGRGFRTSSAAIDLEVVKGEWVVTPVAAPATRPTTKPATKPATKPSE